MIDFSLSPEQGQLREQTIRFAREVLSEGAEQRDREGQFSRDLWKQCGEMGFLGLPVAEEFGGGGFDAITTALTLEALGYGCEDSGLVFSVAAHLLSCVVPVWEYGSEEQRERYLLGMCSGELVAANGMSEPGSGSDAFAMATRAVPDGDGFRISGRKTFASNGPVADVVLLFALTDPEKAPHGGMTAFLVDRDTPGFERTPPAGKMGLRSSLIGDLVFDDVWVGPEAVLGGVGGGGRVFTRSM